MLSHNKSIGLFNSFEGVGRSLMAYLKAILDPQRTSGSFCTSLVIHGVLCGLVLQLFASKVQKIGDPNEFLNLGYQTFEEPPPPAVEEKAVRRFQAQSTPTIVPKTVIPQATREIQDEKGIVSGAQAAPKENQINSDSQGSGFSTPYYKIKPKYPKAALVSGTEGWVLMAVDINEEGAVENVRVIDGENRNLFQSEARRAVALWKYKPFVDSGGLPFKKRDHQVRVDFKLKELESAAPM